MKCFGIFSWITFLAFGGKIGLYRFLKMKTLAFKSLLIGSILLFPENLFLDVCRPVELWEELPLVREQEQEQE
jgi:hypothetical protein